MISPGDSPTIKIIPREQDTEHRLMAFQVTQCPNCESTFNTNLGLLDMAEGKVRCGACLSVFLAEENFIDTNMDEAEDEQESVFIGGQPADFFDPSQFLNRSALNEEAQGDEDDLFQEPVADDVEATNAEAPQEAPTDSAAEEISDQPLPLSPESQPGSGEFHNEALPNGPEAESEEEYLEFFAAIDESLHQFDESDDITELEEIAALDPHRDQEHDNLDPFAKGDAEVISVDGEVVIDAAEADQQDNPPVDSLPSPPDPPSQQASPRPEEFSMNASFAMQFGISRGETRQTQEEETESSAIETDNASTTEVDQVDSLEAQVRQAIEEQDFAAAVEAGLREEPSQDPELQPAEKPTESLADETPAVFEPGEVEQPEAAEQSSQPAVEKEEHEIDTSTEAIRERALRQELDDEEALEQIPRENLQSLKGIAPPVQLYGERQRSFGRTLTLLTLILLFGGTLTGQYLWRYQDIYSVNPRYRAAYEFVCGQLACELPEYSAIEAIRSDNLAVRSHPDREDGLMVTVEIRNTADFPQRFPILILGFNSASNQVIALREFAPGEYLDAGLQQFEFMPVASPVQVALPIMDPGSDAANYTLAFRTP